MSKRTEQIGDRVIELVMKFVNLKAVVAIKDGMMYTLPITLIGSIFLLLANIPIPAFNAYMVAQFGKTWTDPLLQAYNSSFSIIGLIAVFAIAYSYTKREGHEAVPAGIIALIVFLITLTQSVVGPDKTTMIGGVIPRTWLGGKGMVTAIIIGLLVGYIYSWFIRKKITIKLPDSVPTGVSNQFAALIPGFVIIVGATVLYYVFKNVLHTTFIEFIYKVLQTPLQGFSDSLPGAILIAVFISFFWWFGVHGSQIVNAVTQSLLIANMAANQQIMDGGQALTMANGAHVVTDQFRGLFLQFGGSGLTLGLVLCMILVGRSAQAKSVGKLAIGPGLFNINEPVLFGFPIVMNPLMFIPFVLAPTVAAVITYFAIKTGIVPPFGVNVPWTTPPIISGFLVAGWRGSMLQIVLTLISTAIYFPFFKRQDRILLEQEQGNATDAA